MPKFIINDENEILKEGEKFGYPTKLYLSNIQNYINNHLVNFFNIQIENGLELVVENGTYLVFNDEIIYKPICHLLNVDYKEMEKEKTFDYYYTMFQSKLAELSLIKTEEDLLIKFPELYSLYTKRKEQILEALEIYSRSYRVFPSREANAIRTKYFLKYKISEKLYNQLLMEASCFNLAYFINCVQYDVANLLTSLPMIINSISSFVVDVNTLPCFDDDKISLILEDELKLKR